MSKDDQGRTSWAAGVAGAGVGAASSYVVANTVKKNRGFIGNTADKMFQGLDHFLGSPEKVKKFTKDRFGDVQKAIGGLEKNIAAVPDSAWEELKKAGPLSHFKTAEEVKEHVSDLIGTIKGSTFEEVEGFINSKVGDSNIWDDAHKIVKDFKGHMESAGLKRSALSRIPGGVHTLTGVGGIIGAALAMVAVADITKAQDSGKTEAAPTR